MTAQRAGAALATRPRARGAAAWLPHVACGFCVALVAEIWLPGQHVREYATAALLSLAGSIAGTALARGLFPGYLLKQGGYVLAAIGSLAALLLHSLLAG